jgi:hypothetical protein
MSADRDLPRIVRSWLREDAHEDADRVLFTVLEQVDTTPQRRAGWLARRYPLMSKTLRIALVAAAVVIVAVIGYRFLPSSNTGGPGASASPSPTQVPTATPAASAPGFPVSGSLEIGRHPMTLVGQQLSIELTTAVWTSNGQWGIDRGNVTGAGAASFIFWPDSAPDNVFADPCAETLLSPAPGSSAAELAAAVAAIPGIELVSGPSEVTVGGYPAQHVAFSVPEDIGCAPDQFYLWEDLDTPGAARYATQLGETFYIWIIDVNGAIVWIDGETYPTSGPDAAREVQQIVDSIQFE